MGYNSTPRSRSRTFGPNYRNVDFAYTSGKTGTWSEGPYRTSQDIESIDDVVTPGYHRLIKEGAIINNPCLYSRSYLWPSGQGYAHFTKFGGSDSFEQSGPLTARSMEKDFGPGFMSIESALPSYSLTTANADRAKLSAIANIDSTPYSFGEDAFEIKETLRFLRKPLGAIGEIADAFRRTKVKYIEQYGMGIAKASASAYLQYQFAFSPLVRSVTDALEAYSDKEKAYPPRLTARGFSIENFSDSGNVDGGAYRHYSYSRSHDLNYKASILYSITNPVRDWRWKLGFRAKDLPTTFWQIVPLSFMIDRVYDVSSFSKGIINLADPRVKILAGSVTKKDAYKLNFECTGQDDTSSYRTDSWTAESIKYEEFSYDRAVWGPSVSDTIPKVNLPNLTDTATKISELTALILGRLL